MGFGLIGIGRNQADQAISGFNEASKLETDRNEAKKTMDFQQEQASQQMKGTMAGVGAMAGAEYGMQAGAVVGGPVGAALGAVGGLILGSLF
jgi:uncharacterized membrane protein